MQTIIFFNEPINNLRFLYLMSKGSYLHQFEPRYIRLSEDLYMIGLYNIEREK